MFGAPPARDIVRWFSDASALTRYGIETVNYGTSSGLPDPDGENLEIAGLRDIAAGLRARRHRDLRGARVRLVTFETADGGRRPGALDGEEIVGARRCPTCARCFERGARSGRSRRAAASASRSPTSALRAPIVPKKFFHTSGNFREHEDESKVVGWSHEIAPWIVFFQNVDAIIGPDEPIIYPEHLTDELDHELELAVIIGQAGQALRRARRPPPTSPATRSSTTSPRATSSAARCARACSPSARRSTRFCPLGPWIVTPDEVGDPHDLAMRLRVNGELRQESNTSGTCR